MAMVTATQGMPSPYAQYGYAPPNAAVGTGAGPYTNPDGSVNWDNTLSGLISTGAGVYGAQNAAQSQQQGISAGIGTQQNTLQNILGQYAPQATTGNAAFGTLGGVLGLNGQAPNPSIFENMPGYQFAVNQGTQAIQRAATANGSIYTPNTLVDIGKYVTGTAAQDYNTYVNQLLQTAGFGSQANQNISNAALTTGGNISQLQQNSGVAGASGVAGTSGAISSALGRLPWGSIAGSIGSGLGKLFSNGGSTAGTTNNSGVDNSTVDTSQFYNPTLDINSNVTAPTDANGNVDWLGNVTSDTGF